MERTDFDYDPERDQVPKKITWIIIALTIAAAIYLSMILV
jgi:hypothetical protein